MELRVLGTGGVGVKGESAFVGVKGALTSTGHGTGVWGEANGDITVNGVKGYQVLEGSVLKESLRILQFSE